MGTGHPLSEAFCAAFLRERRSEKAIHITAGRRHIYCHRFRVCICLHLATSTFHYVFTSFLLSISHNRKVRKRSRIQTDPKSLHFIIENFSPIGKPIMHLFHESFPVYRYIKRIEQGDGLHAVPLLNSLKNIQCICSVNGLCGLRLCGHGRRPCGRGPGGRFSRGAVPGPASRPRRSYPPVSSSD